MQPITQDLKSTEDIQSLKAAQLKMKRAAHDIRSPLSALNLATSGLTNISPERLLLVQQAIQRINDIAEDLLDKPKVINSVNPTTSMESLSSLIMALVNEKRMQFSDYAGKEIQLDLNDSRGAFVDINCAELRRVISNLVNNAVEASEGRSGKVIVGVRMVPHTTENKKSQVEIFIQDDGKGIPEFVLKRLGRAGVTFGKIGLNSGSGLGVHHAKETIESFGGELKIESKLGHGTTVRLILPLA